MLPKKFRTTLTEFHNNKNTVIKLISYHLIFFIKKNNSKYPRFVVSVVKALDKRSVYRHQTKRVIIESLRKYLAVISKQADVLIKARKIIKKMQKLEIEREVADILGKAGLST